MTTPLHAAALAKLQEAEAAMTPGPWAWFNSKWETHLATVNHGRIYVMGFARRGMRGAQPMFQVRDHGEEPGGGVMRTAAELGDALRDHPDAAGIVLLRNNAAALIGAAEREARLREALETVAQNAHDDGHLEVGGPDVFRDCANADCRLARAALAPTDSAGMPKP